MQWAVRSDLPGAFQDELIEFLLGFVVDKPGGYEIPCMAAIGGVGVGTHR